ncbi:hypothetical protein ACFXMT_38235, partial [Streptomyces mirabilis]|uniref:hypothetical protein n=1 Tax=Streptomyces mirabilis TaxID=68239 RepID=UPI00368CFFD6
ENQRQQKNEKQGNHSYQPPQQRVPRQHPAMHPKFMGFSSFDAGMRYRPETFTRPAGGPVDLRVRLRNRWW